MKNLIYLSVLLLFISCSEFSKEDNYKNQFKEYSKKIMNDPESLEFVDFLILEGIVSHKANVQFIRKNSPNITEEQRDSIRNIQEDVIFTIRAKNAFGAKVLKSVSAYFIDGELAYVDGEQVY